MKKKKEVSQVHWFFLKWPNWLKVVAAIGTTGGAIGTILGLGGTLVRAVQGHDENVRAQVVIAQQLKQRNDNIDKTLAYHGQQIWTIEQKVDISNRKLDTIESEIKK